jgi:hypothetical protein
VIKSYEIEFVGGKNVADILMEVLKTDNRVEEFEKAGDGFRFRLHGAKKRLIIVCRGDVRERGCKVVVNTAKLPENGKIALNANRIARSCGSSPEIAMLGALAKLGVVDIKKLMGVIYRNLGYSHAIAVKRGYEEIRI